MTPNVQSLINELDADNPRQQRHAGNQLIAAGKEALPALLSALATASPRVRKSIAFVLSVHKSSPEVVAALSQAVVDDPEPKVRKNAAMSLGTIGAPEGIPALARALDRESIGWVRPSIVLALGAIGGAQAHTALSLVTPTTDDEREALRKALDRTSALRQAIGWRPGAEQLSLLAEVPVGLERVALDEIAAHGLLMHERTWNKWKPGLLRCPPRTTPADILPALRCVQHILIDAGRGAPLPYENPEACAAAIADLVRVSPAVRHVRDWLDAEGTQINYRVSLDRKNLRRETIRTTLELLREICLPLGLVDSPSRYDLEFIVRSDAEESLLLLKPSFMKDARFAYRQKDVGASINPVVAACLARLVRSSTTATVVDPTCGSATLLIERALLDPATRLRGIDVSRTAVAAARTNVRAAGLEGRIEIIHGDATQPEHYTACDEIIANLPFGVRTRETDAELVRLYETILSNVAGQLQPGGRALLYTAARKTFEAALARHRKRVRIERNLRVLSGGLWSNLWVLSPTRVKEQTP